MKQDSKGIVGVARAVYEQLGKAEFSRGDVEDLAQKIADKVPFEKIGRALAVKLVSVGMKAAEAAGVLYENGTAPEPTSVKEAEVIDVKPSDVIPPGEHKEGDTP